MKRLIASIGLLFLAAQIALGGAGSLFVCLCVGHEDEPSPCAPTGLNAQKEADCRHNQETSSLDEASQQEPCEDLLLVGSKLVKPLDRNLELIKIKASLVQSDFTLSSCLFPSKPRTTPVTALAAGPPLRPCGRTQFADTTRLLL